MGSYTYLFMMNGKIYHHQDKGRIWSLSSLHLSRGGCHPWPQFLPAGNTTSIVSCPQLGWDWGWEARASSWFTSSKPSSSLCWNFSNCLLREICLKSFPCPYRQPSIQSSHSLWIFFINEWEHLSSQKEYKRHKGVCICPSYCLQNHTVWGNDPILRLCTVVS